ncbi:alpha/beta fold hydrolase [Caulobacter rhizosphaerae]|jgi:pimeloyl-ACP methyl ester carboxylesterase|uniref:alpha/beta fold hydrolase n=1 Tax=Caulobacter rhizosphaerae TaxID=2010972 RepID=UPI0013D677A0|nr:alpha/beta hydrolase [Caulobacter rhizosphaerae]GGL10736.1 alpha/beta hydrolase [Caulobacter rhizosphaerae]
MKTISHAAGRHSLSRRGLIVAGAATALAPSLGCAQADALPWRLPEMKTLQIGGQSIAYYDQGSGPAIVLVHGMSGSASLEWGRVIGPLSRDFRVVAPFQIGFGPSSQPDLPYDAETFVSYLGGLITSLGLDRPVMVGESFGGWVVGHYALAQGGPSRLGGTVPAISKLVIVDGALQIKGPPPAGPNPPRSINDPAIGAQAGAVFEGRPRPDNSLVTSRVVGGSIIRQSLDDARLAQIKTPTLVIWGDADELFPAERGRAYAQVIPGARFSLIAGSGHIPSVERPQAFLKALTDFARG